MHYVFCKTNSVRWYVNLICPRIANLWPCTTTSTHLPCSSVNSDICFVCCYFFRKKTLRWPALCVVQVSAGMCPLVVAALRMGQTIENRIIPDTQLILLPEIIVTQSRTEVYAEWLVRHGVLRRNKVFIDIYRDVPFTWRFIDNYDYTFFVCVATK